MSDIDKSKVQAGDRVRIRYLTLESAKLVETVASPTGLRVYADSQNYFGLDWDAVEVIEHVPAPRKVEVTLGQELPDDDHDPARYDDAGAPEDSLKVWVDSDWINTDIGGILFAATEERTETLVALSFDNARRLARDLLATVGVE